MESAFVEVAIGERRELRECGELMSSKKRGASSKERAHENEGSPARGCDREAEQRERGVAPNGDVVEVGEDSRLSVIDAVLHFVGAHVVRRIHVRHIELAGVVPGYRRGALFRREREGHGKNAYVPCDLRRFVVSVTAAAP